MGHALIIAVYIAGCLVQCEVDDSECVSASIHLINLSPSLVVVILALLNFFRSQLQVSYSSCKLLLVIVECEPLHHMYILVLLTVDVNTVKLMRTTSADVATSPPLPRGTVIELTEQQCCLNGFFGRHKCRQENNNRKLRCGDVFLRQNKRSRQCRIIAIYQHIQGLTRYNNPLHMFFSNGITVKIMTELLFCGQEG